jgi:uncharacterized membrane protein
MSKQQTTLKSTQIKSRAGDGHQLEQTQVLDDNLLPDAEEIKKLCEIDPTCMEWLKNRAEKEQAFRHEITNKRINLAGSTEKKILNTNLLGMVLAFIFIMSTLGLSTYLIVNGYILTGSIFTGTTTIVAASLFFGHRLKKT